jgi:hypothetical protein
MAEMARAEEKRILLRLLGRSHWLCGRVMFEGGVGKMIEMKMLMRRSIRSSSKRLL